MESALNSRHFPKDFVFGAAGAAYQYEGAAQEGGKGPSIWDTYTQRFPGKIKDGSNGFTAVDQYNLYKDDVAIMKKMGLKAYRFSICWPRILPAGKLSGGVNKEGIKYYSDLIDELLANGIEPFVTIFHWDLPQALQDEYGGFINARIVEDFRDYVDVLFWEFGDRVKHWITLNEPWTYSYGGYVSGTLAPGRGTSSPEHLSMSVGRHRCHAWHQIPCEEGDPGKEPYWVAHHLLLAHSAAVELYRQKYKASQEGKIGITLVSHWMEPLNEKNESDVKARFRGLDFMLGWFLAPITTGDYPESMRANVGSRLPHFTPPQAEKLKKSYDFLGINYYSSQYVSEAPKSNSEYLSYETDQRVTVTHEKDGKPIGTPSALNWLYSHPEGIHKLLVYIKNTYNVPLIYVTENGWVDANNIDNTPAKGCADELRINYHRDHFAMLLKAIDDGVNVKGHFVWSLLDNYEWGEGYTVRFGMIYIDYKNGYVRYPKDSAKWFMNFLKSSNQHPVPLPSKRRITDIKENDFTKRIKN